MSFYLEPPRGTISLQNLEKFAVKRLDFLIQILQARNDRVKMFDIVQDAINVSDSECLIDGSKKDAISHFILRLALCSDVDTADFLVAAETSLFEFRFLCMNEDELTELFRKTNKIMDKNGFQTCSSCILPLITTFRMLKERSKSWKRVVELYLKGDNSNVFHVPFCYVFNLVAKRQVVLSNGMAAVPFPKLREVVTECFKEVLKEGTRIAREKRQIAELDFRMKKLMRKIVILLRSKHRPFSGNINLVTNLSHDSVSMETHLFPPCMFNLYSVLQQKHRLKHHSRIQFTLFLKEIGMPVHEALMYWRKEYSIPVNNQDGCCHDWKDSEKRYVYNIRHLYGLEGSHINYRAHSCSTLQNFSPFAGEVGSCPFKHFDRQHLNVLLDNLEVDDHFKKKIYKLVDHQEYSKACSQVLNNKGHLSMSKSNHQRNKNDENIDCNESLGDDRYQNKLLKEDDYREQVRSSNVCNTSTIACCQEGCTDCLRQLQPAEKDEAANFTSVDYATSNEDNKAANDLQTNSARLSTEKFSTFRKVSDLNEVLASRIKLETHDMEIVCTKDQIFTDSKMSESNIIEIKDCVVEQKCVLKSSTDNEYDEHKYSSNGEQMDMKLMVRNDTLEKDIVITKPSDFYFRLKSKSNQRNKNDENMHCNESLGYNRYQNKLLKEDDYREQVGLINVCNTGTIVCCQEGCTDCLRQLQPAEKDEAANYTSVDLATSNEDTMAANDLPTNSARLSTEKCSTFRKVSDFNEVLASPIKLETHDMEIVCTKDQTFTDCKMSELNIENKNCVVKQKCVLKSRTDNKYGEQKYSSNGEQMDMKLVSKSNQRNKNDENMHCNESLGYNRYQNKLLKEDDYREQVGLINVCNTGTIVCCQEGCTDCLRQLQPAEKDEAANYTSVDLATSNEDNMAANDLPTNSARLSTEKCSTFRKVSDFNEVLASPIKLETHDMEIVCTKDQTFTDCKMSELNIENKNCVVKQKCVLKSRTDNKYGEQKYSSNGEQMDMKLVVRNDTLEKEIVITKPSDFYFRLKVNTTVK